MLGRDVTRELFTIAFVTNNLRTRIGYQDRRTITGELELRADSIDPSTRGTRMNEWDIRGAVACSSVASTETTSVLALDLFKNDAVLKIWESLQLATIPGGDVKSAGKRTSI